MSLKKRLLVIFLLITVLILVSLGIFLKFLRMRRLLLPERLKDIALTSLLMNCGRVLMISPVWQGLCGDREYPFQKLFSENFGHSKWKGSKAKKISWHLLGFCFRHGARTSMGEKAIPLKTLMKEAEFTTREFDLLRRRKSTQMILFIWKTRP